MSRRSTQRLGTFQSRWLEPAHLRSDDERLRVDRLELNAGATRLSASGRAAADAEGSGSLRSVTANGGSTSAKRRAPSLPRVSPDVPITEGSGPASPCAPASPGSLDKPLIAADLDAGPGSVTIKELSTATDLRLRAHLENDVVDSA